MHLRSHTFILLTMLCLSTSTALAAESKNADYMEYFYQPNAGQHALTTGLIFSTFRSEGKIQGTTSNISTSGTSTSVPINYDYGINETFSVEASIGYSLNQMNAAITSAGVGSGGANLKYEGLSDIGLGLSGRSPVQTIVLYYGLGVYLSPGDRTYDQLQAKGNNYSGGFSAQPKVAASTKIGTNALAGLSISYTVLGERTTKNSNPTTESKSTGGNSISVAGLVEFPMAAWTPGLSLGYSSSEKSKTTTGTSTTEYDSSGTITAMGYANIKAGPSTDFLISAGYGQPDKKTMSGVTLENAYSFSFGVAARFMF